MNDKTALFLKSPSVTEWKITYISIANISSAMVCSAGVWKCISLA